jgi:aryl-alcohol dehydrogenase-like predicted oxidoreductase
VALGCFDAVQATWNLHERAAGAALGRAHEAGMAVIVKEALANGRLTPRVPNPVLERAAGELGATVDAVALAAVLAQPWVGVVLSGVATREALASNLAATELRLPDSILRELAALEEDSEEYWSTRSGLPWN